MTVAWQEHHLLRDYGSMPPWPLYSLGKWVLMLLRLFMNWVQPPPLTVFDMYMGAWRSQVIYTVTTLGVADVLKAGPQTAEEIADKLGVKASQLFRVMRAAVQLGVFTASTGRGSSGQPRFRNNVLSAVLREDHPNSMRHMVLHQTDHNKPAWDQLAWGVRTGGQPFEETHGGLSQFAWLKTKPAEEAKFSKAMTEIDSMGTRPITTDYRWNGYGRIIDIGGAYGSFLAKLLSVNRRPAGVLFDQPQVIQKAREVWKDDGSRSALLERVDFVEGDFFKHETIPAGKDGDVYVLRLILHDWMDADSVVILSNIRAAIGAAKARVVIAETAIQDEFFDPLMQRGLLDVHMLVATNGAERTSQQWKNLFDKSGFKYRSFIPTRGIFSIVEADPA